MIIELLNLLYGVGKDINSYYKLKEITKYIDNVRLEQIKEGCKNKGINISFRWSSEEKIESRKQKGWDYYYEIDNNNKTKAILKLKGGQILIAKLD